MRAFKRIKKLTQVVELCGKLIGENFTVADIGADHGYLSESLNRLENISTVYAVEISEKCLKKVIELKQNYSLSKIVPVLGNGFENITKVDVSVIAGIGGFETIKIVQNSKDLKGDYKSRYFVLQPSDNAVELKKWIYNSRFKIVYDSVFECAKQFYPLIVIDVLETENQSKTDMFNLYFGRDNGWENEDFEKYLLYLQDTLKFIENLSDDRIESDKVLLEKRELKCLVENLLKKDEEKLC